MTASTQVTIPEISAFIPILIFKLPSHKVVYKQKRQLANFTGKLLKETNRENAP